jgi:hypothetical protein
VRGPWHIRFDGGRQQRYLADRREVLRYVLDIGRQSTDPRFELWLEETESSTVAGVGADAGRPGVRGRRFALVEILDLSEPGTPERLRAELDQLADSADSAEESR